MIAVIKELSERPIAFHRIYVALTGSVNAALMLSQAVYWSGRTTIPEGWFYKTSEDWEDETGLGRREQDTARKQLKQTGFWNEKLKGVPATIHYQIDMEKMVFSLAECAKLVAQKRANKIGGKRQTLYTETTTETINIEDSKESSSNNPELFTDTKSQKPINTKRLKKEKKGAHPAFAILKDHWQKVVHPEWVSWGGMEAKNLNEIIAKMTAYSVNRKKKDYGVGPDHVWTEDQLARLQPSPEDLFLFFQHFCKSLPNFYKTATLNVLNSKFDGIIEEIRTGVKPVGHSQKNSADRFSDFYGRV